jgi:magnesium chelatase subunit D
VAGGRLSWAATLRAAALEQANRPESASDGRVRLRAGDLRGWPRCGPAGRLLLFVIDGSGSMAAWRRMRQTKAAVLALLLQAYQHRDRVALLVFRGTGAEVVLPPTRSLRAARAALEALPVGGTTPLAGGLQAARWFLAREQRRQRHVPVWTVLLTDGRANVPLGTGAAEEDQAWHDALNQARAWAGEIRGLVVDTETGWPRFGRAPRLAEVLQVACLPIEAVLGRPLSYRLPAAG